MDCKFGSEAVDEGDSGDRLQRNSSRIKDIVVGVAAESTTSSSEQQDQPHRRMRIKEGIFVRRGSATGSRTSLSEEPWTDHPRRHRGSRGSASPEERRRGLLHPQIPGASIFYYSDFSSLQSRVVPVWGWLSLDVFEYRKFSPGGLQVRVEGRVRRRFGRSSTRISSRINDIIVRGSATGSRTSSSEKQQDQPHRRRRIKGRIFVRRGSAAGSRTSSSEEPWKDHPRRHRGSRGSASPSAAEVSTSTDTRW